MTSFTFGVNNTLLYFKSDTSDPQKPESSLYRVGMDGAGQTRVTQGESGFSVLLGQ